ncbi:polyamine-modulated factor 1-binding protein [Rhynchospora pubera]|uniref:Polyamine-modulated factor 1-binding protein n=1 Tax=Rhynchospora pubera TaxID=906938 RepID=A0AAV8E7B6_9POAL|nr:polyamine-modulated factor 1-binding protein [Rhynchospora pubera]KAJ4806316.1 polyamine-modulated factor 1-binding protein [Rhynchospora pubera]
MENKQNHTEWIGQLENQQSQVNTMHEKLANMATSEEDSKRELEYLQRRVKTIATLLNYLKSKARIIEIPHLAHTSCGIKHEEGIGLVDKKGVPLSDWSKNFANVDEENTLRMNSGGDGGALDDILKSVHVVTDVMETLVKRVVVAESEAKTEKEKVRLGLEEIKKKTVQIDCMSARVEEMERFAVGTNTLLNEMRGRVEEMVLETSRQRQRAAENEAELSRVKQDFESLRSYVGTLISARESILSSEKQLQSVEKLFDRMMAKNSQLENEKAQKEAEAQKLFEENVRLRAQLDQKEAQLVAMNEQFKFMALNDPNF